MILTSLQDNAHVAMLLGFSRSFDPHLGSTSSSSLSHSGSTGVVLHSGTQLAEMLMKTLLRNLSFHTVTGLLTCCLSQYFWPFSLVFAVFQVNYQTVVQTFMSGKLQVDGFCFFKNF